MKRVPLLAAAVFAVGLSLLGRAQRIIENPAKSLNPASGRVVTVEEAARIKDTGQDFYFKSVNGIRISPRGDVFVRSGFDQVLQFDPQGRFLRDLVKKGRGPGEISGVSDIFAASDRIHLLSAREKILTYDLEGRLVDEVGLREAGGPVTKILTAGGGTFFVTRENSPTETGLVQCPEDILAVPSGGGGIKVVGSFPLPKFAFLMDDGRWAAGGHASLIAVPFNDRQVFLSHTPEYLVKLFDAGTGKVLRAFRRDYPRVKRKSQGTPAGPEPNIVRQMRAITPKDLNDINDLHVVDGRLWVQTSTFDPEKGVLFDVFGPEGRFEDSFFLKWWSERPDRAGARKAFTFAGGYAYFADTTEDGLIVIRKCRIRF